MLLRTRMWSLQKGCEADDEIDMLFDQVRRELISYMIEDPKKITAHSI